MPVFRVTGKFWPALGSLPNKAYQYRISEPTIGTAQTDISIRDKEFVVEIRTGLNVSRKYGPLLIQIARDQVMGIVNVVAIKTGMPNIFLIEKFVDEKGISSRVNFGRDTFPEIWGEIFTESGKEDKIIELVNNESNSFKILNDLMDAIQRPYANSVSCSIAIDGIKLALSGGNGSQQEQWKSMREKLNISLSSLQSISELSKMPRHGHFECVSHKVIHPIIDLTCKIVARYFEFRIGGYTDALPSARFPVL